MKKKKGFTLIELLIVIGIIAVLMAIAIVAINPGRQFAKANNARRFGDVAALADAISINIIDGKGTFSGPAACVTEFATVSSTLASLAYDDPTTGTDDGNVDLCNCLVPSYLGSMPLDPTTSTAPAAPPCTGYNTGYQISTPGGGRIKISAPTIDNEGSGTPTEISVTR